ncbi:alpha/beta hydrolase [Actinoplanes sp. NPDC051475]|uniref:alpha/beta hydrolase n=1 Tax=Actinoplanes sp. NPDC051475 TaxID=3157225 RepID=UPI00344BAD44
MSLLSRRLGTAGIAGVLLVGVAATPSMAAPTAGRPVAAAQAATFDTTTAKERQRVDSIEAPKLGWYKCFDTAECATTRLPLDYDKPHGATTEIAVLRVKAKDQQHKIGTLFVNPGGPGGSGTDIALAAPSFLSESILQRFDVVGIDPRGIAASENVHCFPSVRDQTKVLADMNVAFPWGKAEEKKYVKAAKKFGKACSTTGKPLTGAMSTAEVVRDMEVLRRSVGDTKLSYLGFSYGTAIGQYYANMFPERFRAVVVDGVLDPQHWVGTTQTADQEQDQRLQSAEGAYRALKEILKRCDRAGKRYCVFSAGDPVKRFETIAKKLRQKPLVVGEGADSYTITYADFIGGVLGSLYGTGAGDSVTFMAQDLWTLLNPPSPAAATKARTALIQRIKDSRSKPSRDFPYDNGFETFAGVDCTDGLHPKDADKWPAMMEKADKRAPYFGRAWGWGTAQCARNTWTVHDEDAYTGPWTRRTAAPVLIVGTKWDPATNYDDAVSAARRLPNSRLLSNTNWGHTSYGSSKCATGAIDSYLLTGKLPAAGTVCEGDLQPFTEPLPTDETRSSLRAGTATQGRPPVATPLPPSVLNGNR